MHSNLISPLQIGLDDIENPHLLYFEERLPHSFIGNLSDVKEVLAWLVEQKTGEHVPELEDGILENVIDSFDFVAAYFPARCKEEESRCLDEKAREMESLEEISASLADLGVVAVVGEQRGLAGKDFNVTSFPALVLFRNGKPLAYPQQSISDVAAAVNWLSSSWEIEGQIERVGEDMLRHIIDSGSLKPSP